MENLKIEDERQKKSHALFQAIDAVLELVVEGGAGRGEKGEAVC